MRKDKNMFINKKMFLMVLFSVFASFLCACSKKEKSNEEKIFSCAILMHEEGKDIDDDDYEKCKKLHQKNIALQTCGHMDDAFEYYDCVYERAGLKELKSSGNKSYKKKCGDLYEKFVVCTKEMDDDKIIKEITGEGKEKFVSECVKEFDKAKKMIDCVDRETCGEFFKCAIGINPIEMKRQLAMPPDSEDMPRYEPRGDE